ncbi:MAG TPA: response regulator transcription factor [Steroidobacteraceae bacterium]|jgi:DNA-binding NarL/FixJ family response regulator
MTAPVRVLLVDDHAVVREGYRRLLEREPDIEVVGEAGNATQACEQALALCPDVVVMDIALPGTSGIEAMRRMLTERPRMRVLMFSMHDDAIFSSRALEAGALGYLSKASAPEVLLQAIHDVSRGERYVSPDVAANMARSASSSGLETLTAREFEVLRLLVQGETLKDIGERLGLSEKTVANHQSTIREKLGAKNGMQLARLGARLGLT